MHGDVVRLNALIAQNEGMSKKLAEANFSLEKEFVVELKVCPTCCWCMWLLAQSRVGVQQELEKQSQGLEASIAQLKEDKAKILEDILDAERQVLLWEKKIQLEKETQAALDPSVGFACSVRQPMHGGAHSLILYFLVWLAGWHGRSRGDGA